VDPRAENRPERQGRLRPGRPQNARLEGHEGRSFHVAATVALVFLAVVVVLGLAVAAFLYQAVQH